MDELNTLGSEISLTRALPYVVGRERADAIIAEWSQTRRFWFGSFLQDYYPELYVQLKTYIRLMGGK